MKNVTLIKDVKIPSKSQACQRAFLRGKEEGIEEGYQKANRESEAFVTLIQSVTFHLLEHKERLCKGLKSELIHLAITICEKVIRSELAQPEILAKLIHAQLASFSSHMHEEIVKISLSPDDLVLLENFLNKISYDKKEIKRLRFVSDTSLCRGDFRIETEKSLLNSSIQRELEDLKQTVLQG